MSELRVEDQGIRYESLDYGAYILDWPSGSVFNEDVKYSSGEFNKLNVRRLRLPAGRGNIIYLLSETFEKSLMMTQSKNYWVPPSYRRFFYPWISRGSFMGRRYILNVTSQKKYRVTHIRTTTKLVPYSTRFLPKISENIFFDTSDIYQTFKPIMVKFPIKRIFSEFYGEFLKTLESLTPPHAKESDNKEFNNKILVFDVDSFNFKIGASLEENKTNPLFLLYLAFLRSRDLSKLKIDQDMLICSRNMFMKFNPASLNTSNWSKFKVALFRIMNANLDNYTDQLTDEDKKEIEDTSEEHITHGIVADSIAPYTKNISPETASVLNDAIDQKIRVKVLGNNAIAKIVQSDQEAIANEIDPVSGRDLFQREILDRKNSLTRDNPYDKISHKRQSLYDAIIKDYRPLATRTNEEIPTEEDNRSIQQAEEIIRDDVNDIITNDTDLLTEVDDEIQDKIAPLKNLKTAPVNSARDQKLREAQKKVVVQNSTLEEILSRDTANIPIRSEDKSAVLKTSNKNMHTVTFANFDRTYIDELYYRDLVACFDMLKDKDTPFYIVKIDIQDTSTNMDLKETWTVTLVDEAKKRHTIKVDIPKFYNGRMFIGGNKYNILKQNMYNPLVKDTKDEVILTTNFNKITIRRRATKSLATIEKIFSLIRKTGESQYFITGDSSKGNLNFISTLEYDEFSQRIFQFSSGRCTIYFSRDYLFKNLDNLLPRGIDDKDLEIKNDEFLIGFEGREAIIINEDTGKDRFGRSISEIIEHNLPENMKQLLGTIKAPRQSMFAEAKLAGQWLPVGTILIVWIGLRKMLDKMEIRWEFHSDVKRIPKDSNDKFIRFSDGILEYENKTFAELILNGIIKMQPQNFTFDQFNTEESYIDFVKSFWGSNNGITELRNFYEFLVDHITKGVCRDLNFPTEPDEILIHAVKLLCDNASVSKASDKSYRVRSIEMIPSILYSEIARQYKDHINSGRRRPMTLEQRIVFSKLQAEKSVDEHSTLNPAIEVAKTHTISTKGYKGSNSDHSYDEEKRSYDPSAIGKIAMSTSADANVGVNREIVIEPTLTNARGYRDQVDDPYTLKDVNIFSPVEMLTPGTAANEDPIRTAIANKQSQHLVPVEAAEPTLVSNGFDEALQFHLSNDFVINAEEDGKVVEINEALGFIMVEYKSGRHFAINIKPEIVKNSGGGFYLTNQLRPSVTKIGERFKKDEVLAYHDKYFRYSKLNGLRYAIGPVVKVAFMSSYNTYEDAGICTKSLAEKMRTRITYMEVGLFKKNSNILHMVNIGDKVEIGDPLIRHDHSFDDTEIAKFMTKLSSEENKAKLSEDIKEDLKANHAGTVVDIKIYTLHDPSNLSPSLGRVVQKYFDIGNNKRKFLEKYDKSTGTIKAGYMLTDSTEPIVTRYNTIKGKYKGVDVLIEIYIENSDLMGVGDKIALYSANKQIVSEVIPEGYEPYSEFAPDEEISVMTSPGTIARRMTPAVIPISAAMKIMIELKRKIAKEIKYK